jgi:DNA polymerase III alpha subunit
MPDIDIDFESGEHGRDLVKEYLRTVYGHDHVADIIAYQTFAPKSVIKSVAQTQDFNFKALERVTDSIDDLDRNLELIATTNEVVAEFKKDYPEIWKHCLRLEDQILRDTKHAGGVLITPKPVTTYMPTQLGTDEQSVVTAWSDRIEFPIVSDYGFMKWDVLGVKSLNKQQYAVDLIADAYGDKVEPNSLAALRDPAASEQTTIDGFVKGLTVGIFQFGGRGITQLLRHIKPDTVTDISVANALYRPGPIKIAFEYGDRKQGKVPVTYWHDSLEPLLEETLGLIAFQEQVMEITKALGNFSGGEADSMRKAISKLYRLPGDEARNFMQQFFEMWMQGCRDNHIKDRDAREIWERILEFAGYGFNRSHSSSYGLQAYQDMWLKTTYPLALYASVLTYEKKQKRDDQIAFLKATIREATAFDIEVDPPDINRSDRGWTVLPKKNRLRYGFVSIDGIGAAIADEIITNKPYKSLKDIHRRAPGVNSGGLLALAKAGALDRFDDREYLLGRTNRFDDGRRMFDIQMTCGCKKVRTVKFLEDDDEEEKILRTMAKVHCSRHEGSKIVEYEERDGTQPVVQYIKEHEGAYPEDAELAAAETMAEMETQTLYLPITLETKAHQYNEFIERKIFTEQEFDALPAKPPMQGKKHGMRCPCKACKDAAVVVGGEITNITTTHTKKTKEEMAFLDVAFGANQWSLTLFPAIWRQYQQLLNDGTLFLFSGHKDDFREPPSIIVNDVADVYELAEREDFNPDGKQNVKKVKRASKTRA